MEIHQLLAFAVDNAATEVLLSAGLPPMLRFADGLKPAKMEPVTTETMDEHLRQVLSPERLQQLYRDGQIELVWPLRPGASFRATVFADRSSWGITFRLMPTDVLPPEKLLLPKGLSRIVEGGSGLVLVAAPPGHGRSTTLLSLVDVVNRQRAAHILTLERRLKVRLESVKSVIFQRELGDDPHSTEAALKVACIQDPDVLMVTHLPSGTLEPVLQLLGRDRLVLAGVEGTSTLEALRLLLSSTNDEAKERVKLLRAALASSLRMVVAQKLLPRADRSGRVLASEVLPIEVEQARMLRTGDFGALGALLQSHGAEGVLSMDRCIQLLFKRKLVERDIARRHMNDEKLLES